MIIFISFSACAKNLENYENLVASDISDAPLILPDQPDVTLEVGSNFTMACESKVPITWRTFSEVSLNIFRLYFFF